jgi:hypothetical protein
VLQLASENWQSVQEEIGLADPELAVFLGPEDSATIARLQLEATTGLEAIDPPPFAIEWHQFQIDRSQLLTDIYDYAATGPGALRAYVEFWDRSEELSRDERPIYVETKSSCSQFEEAWKEIALVDGQWEPPDAGLDLSVCDGLEQYDADMRLAVVTALAENPDLVPAYIAARTMEDLSTLAPEELLAVAEVLAALGEQYDLVVPPDYARAWHDAYVADISLSSDFVEAVPESGAEAANEAFADERLAQQAAVQAAIEESIPGCAIFPEYAESQ